MTLPRHRSVAMAYRLDVSEKVAKVNDDQHRHAERRQRSGEEADEYARRCPGEFAEVVAREAADQGRDHDAHPCHDGDSRWRRLKKKSWKNLAQEAASDADHDYGR